MLWVSDRAKARWNPEIKAFRDSWGRLESLTVFEKIRRCALISTSHDELISLSSIVSAAGYKIQVLHGDIAKSGRDRVLGFRVAIGSQRDIKLFDKAWKAGNDMVVGELLGYPPCCCKSFARIFIDGLALDPACALVGVLPSALPELSNLEGYAELNPLWISLGIRLIPHIACCAKCEESRRLAEKFRALAEASGNGDAFKTCRQMLEWPTEWSCLHGIAEIKTPIVKVSLRTDYSSSKKIVRWRGTGYPLDGARGLSYPFAPPRRKLAGPMSPGTHLSEGSASSSIA
jgi:hypothetical protein